LTWHAPLVGDAADGYGSVRLASAGGRWVLAVAVFGEAMTLLEATVVNVSLPEIGRDLDADMVGLQWTLNGYVLTLAALILLGGSLGDRYGRRRAFNLGVVVFLVASAFCAAAPSIELLIFARILQGIGGGSSHTGSLAIIDAVFHPDDRLRAIGAGQDSARSRRRSAPLSVAFSPTRCHGEPSSWSTSRWGSSSSLQRIVMCQRLVIPRSLAASTSEALRSPR
jgi:MFS family permease